MIKASEMMQVGLALNLISVGVLILFITTYGEVIYHVWDTDTALSANNNVTCG